VLRTFAPGRALELRVVGAATLAFVVGYVWLSRIGIDLADEGYFLDLASRVQAGQLPYRDFETYYTPGIFYVNSAVLTLFGANVLPARLALVGVRLGCALLAYGLARRLAGPAFAAVPAILLGVAGVLAGFHPGWPALLATLLMLTALVRAHDLHDRRWLVAAGAAAALAFAFKQNVGAFALVGAVGYVVLVSAAEAGVLLLVVRAIFAAALAVTTHRFLEPLLDPMLALTVWSPLVGVLIVLVGWSHPRWNRVSLEIGTLLRDGAALVLGAALLTTAWLAPLVLALGFENTPFSLFAGQVNQGALLFALDGLPRATASLALVAILAPLAAAFSLRPRPSVMAAPTVAAGAVLLVVFQFPTRGIPLDPLTARPELFPRLAALDIELGSLLIYLPAVCAWTAIVLLATQRSRAQRPPPAAWFVLVGALAQLALFPRADVAHAVLAGAPLLIVGAWVLSTIHAALSRGVPPTGRAAIFATLMLLPAAAIAPHLYGRSIALRHAAEPDSTVAADYDPLGLDRAAVLLPQREGQPLRDAVAFVRDGTPPGEPLFAYPMDPLVNFLADRPNPTRFDHFLPGALTPDDMQRVVVDLDAARPRYVFWDHAAVVFWETDRPNRILSDYIWRCYKQVATFRLYLLLERSEC
jgi:Dolichyl-phosphate-mannose-protein mannosyltransferase